MNLASELDRLVWANGQLALRRCRESLRHFGAAVVRGPDGKPLEFSLLHLAWIAHLEYCWARDLHAGIFGRGASGFLVTLAAWLLGKDPAHRAAVVCNSDRHAALRLRAIRSLTSAPRFRRVFPQSDHEMRWGDGLALPGGRDDGMEPRLEVRGATARPVGQGYTHLLLDGVTDAASTATAQRREAQKTTVAGWLAALGDGGRVVWVSRAWNPDDVSYQLRERKDFCWLDQRQEEDGVSQEVHGAGDDYLAFVTGRLRELVDRG